MYSNDFTYSVPSNFKANVARLLRYHYRLPEVAEAFENSSFGYEDIGNAYRAAHIRGDNWDMNAVNFTIETHEPYYSLLLRHKDTVRSAFNFAIQSKKSGYQVNEIVCLPAENVEIFPTSDFDRFNEVTEKADSLLHQLLKIGERLCLNITYNGSTPEDSINDYFRDMLEQSNTWKTKDQTRHGSSPSGKNAGEVDILVTEAEKEVALIEGLKLTCMDRSSINRHVDKVLTSYNALGSPAFILCYINTDNFEAFWEKCLEHLKGYNYPVDVRKQIIEKPQRIASSHVATMVVSRDGFDFPFYFVAFKLLDK